MSLKLRLHCLGKLRRARRWSRRSALLPFGLAGLLHPAIERPILDAKVASDFRDRSVRLVAQPHSSRDIGLGVLLGFRSHGCSSVESTESGPGHTLERRSLYVLGASGRGERALRPYAEPLAEARARLALRSELRAFAPSRQSGLVAA